MHVLGEIIYGKEGKVYDRPVTGSLYYSDVIKGKRVRLTADVSGILSKEGGHDVFEIHASSIVVTQDGRAGSGSVLVGAKIAMKQ